jgi:hypothetical protein
MLHTYAPRSVDVEVDEHIVTNLRRAYEPAVGAHLAAAPRGRRDRPRPRRHLLRARRPWSSRLRDGLGAQGVAVADGETYPLHPSTLAWDHALAHPGRTLCVEVRRDLVAEPFEPFAEMRIGAVRLKKPLSPASMLSSGPIDTVS